MKAMPFLRNAILASLCVYLLPLTSSAQWNNSPGVVWTNDKVGVGVAAPQSLLHLQTGQAAWPWCDMRFSLDITTPVNGQANGQIAVAHLSAGSFSDAATLGDFVIRTAGPAVGGITDLSEDLILAVRNATGALRFTTWDQTSAADTEKMTILPNGNVGIGINNPASPLHIRGLQPVGGNYLLQLSSGDSQIGDQLIQFSEFGFGLSNIDRGTIFQYSWTSEDGDLVTINNRASNDPQQADQLVLSQTKGLRLYTDNKEQARLTPQGQLWIGVDFSDIDNGVYHDLGDYKLAVNGKIKTEELLITTQSWPDYVFEPDYSLPSLDQVADFIEDNGHLPGIPSATEVIDKGIDVEDMQHRLLLKIEELTLYLLEMKEENQSLAGELAQLKQQLADSRSQD